MAEIDEKVKLVQVAQLEAIKKIEAELLTLQEKFEEKLALIKQPSAEVEQNAIVSTQAPQSDAASISELKQFMKLLEESANTGFA